MDSMSFNWPMTDMTSAESNLKLMFNKGFLCLQRHWLWRGVCFWVLDQTKCHCVKNSRNVCWRTHVVATHNDKNLQGPFWFWWKIGVDSVATLTIAWDELSKFCANTDKCVGFWPAHCSVSLEQHGHLKDHWLWKGGLCATWLIGFFAWSHCMAVSDIFDSPNAAPSTPIALPRHTFSAWTKCNLLNLMTTTMLRFERLFV